MIFKRIGEIGVMWEVLFFRYTPIILAVAGSLTGCSIYIIHNILMKDYPDLAGAAISLLSAIVPALAGLICGKLIQRLHQCAHQDQLTNLWNSRHFHSEITKEITRLRRTQSTSCLALIDIDDFKRINDTYGHVIGDEVLRNIADVFAKNTRAHDIVVRLGGDEFVILFPDTSIECASLLTERLRKLIANHEECYQATISVGVLLVNANADINQLLTVVDETLYQAKKTKKLVVIENFS